MLSHKHAIVQLFEDDDPETVRLVKEQLAQRGREIVEELKQLGAEPGSAVSRHANEVLQNILERDAKEDLTLLCHFFGDSHSLENVSWTLSQCLQPEIDTKPYEAQIRAWGRKFLLRSAEAASNRDRVKKLAEFIHGELGFEGNTKDYYNEKNSLLPTVIDTRKGNPISLTLIYMFVAERAGMKVCGVNLPGHFLARYGSVIFDPFNGGKILNRAACQKILDFQRITLSERHLNPATPRQMFVRMLVNLLYIYDLEGDRTKYALINSWLQILTGSFSQSKGQ